VAQIVKEEGRRRQRQEDRRRRRQEEEEEGLRKLQLRPLCWVTWLSQLSLGLSVRQPFPSERTSTGHLKQDSEHSRMASLLDLGVEGIPLGRMAI